jgi:3'(2'), 5'-bisphosphate nucleotidase
MEPSLALPLLAEVRAVARDAANAIMQLYSGRIVVERKADRTPVTEADRAAHDIILAGLGALATKLPVLSEECAPEELHARRDWARYWLVDPLDGTKEFIKRNDEFTVNIALVDAHAPVLGVVLAPALGVEYYGAFGCGAWRRRGDSEIAPIEVSRKARYPLRAVGSRSHLSPQVGAFLSRLGPYTMRAIGSSLKICLVADGSADIYPRLGPTCEWDTAAAQAVLESAGGCMIDVAGRPLRYNSKEDLINPHFLAFGDRERAWLAAIRNE